MIDLTEAARHVFLGTLKAIQPDVVIKRELQIEDGVLTVCGEEILLDDYAEVVLIGLGKASVTMGSAVEALLGNRIKRAILVVDQKTNANLRSEVIVAGHPLPDHNSLIAGEKICELVASCNKSSLILFLISGGGSSLVELPMSSSISLDELRETNRVLVGCGAPIGDINILRKMLSQIKGGKLGVLAGEATKIGLYISDVNPGDLRSIASNPILPEKIDIVRAVEVLNRFNLWETLPDSVVKVIEDNSSPTFSYHAGSVREPTAILLLDNSHAIDAAVEQAGRLGFRVRVDSEWVEGAYQLVAERLLESLLQFRGEYPNEPVCLVSGGEVLCAVHGSGVGGRNQEFVLYSATRLSDFGFGKQAAVLSCGTDGIDGNSKAAGAVADAELVNRARLQGLDASIFISNNDSNSFFKKSGGLVVTGPTGNNVRDLRILVAQ